MRLISNGMGNGKGNKVTGNFPFLGLTSTYYMCITKSGMNVCIIHLAFGFSLETFFTALKNTKRFVAVWL